MKASISFRPRSPWGAAALTAICFAACFALTVGLMIVTVGDDFDHMTYAQLMGMMAINSLGLFGLAGALSRPMVVGLPLRTTPVNAGWLQMAVPAVIIALVAMPLIEWAQWASGELFRVCPLLEDALGGKSQDDMLMTRMLTMEGPLQWTLALVTVALLPAVCEELFFRGSLMPLVRRLTGSWHMAVLVTAVIFSYIHMDASGFLPRAIMGGLFGCVALMTRRLWPAMFMHFINNAMVVIQAGTSDQPVAELLAQAPENPGVLLTVFSLALTLFELHFLGVATGFHTLPNLDEIMKELKKDDREE